jgi:hypothetical protein
MGPSRRRSEQTPVNFVALAPLSFLARTSAIYPDHVSAVYEGRVFTWSQSALDRSLRAAA